MFDSIVNYVNNKVMFLINISEQDNMLIFYVN